MDTSIIDGAGVGELSGSVRMRSVFSGIFALLFFCIVGLPLAQAPWRRNSGKFCDLSVPFHDTLARGIHNAQ